MSAPEQKDLRAPVLTDSQRAKATLRQLLARWGSVDLVKRSSMGGPEEVWFWVSGSGAESVFEKREAP